MAVELPFSRRVSIGLAIRNIQLTESWGWLEPFDFLKDPKLGEADEKHDSHEPDIAVGMIELGHVERQRFPLFGAGREVHAIDSDDESEWNEDGGDDSEDPHDLVGAEADTGEVKFHEPGTDFLVAFHEIHQLDGVVVAVSQIDLGRGGDEAGWVMDETVDHVAQGPDEAAHLGKIALVSVQGDYHFAGGLFQQLVLKFLNGCSDFFEDGIEVVDDGIKQGVGKIVRLGFSNEATTAPQSGADRLKDVVVTLFLNGNQEMIRKKDTDLLPANGAVVILIDHLGDDEHVIGRLFDFRALPGVQYIFEGQRVEIEVLAEKREGFGVSQTVDVDPQDFFAFHVGAEFLGIGDFVLADIMFVKLDDLDGGFAALTIDQMGMKSRGRGSGWAVALSKHGSNCMEWNSADQARGDLPDEGRVFRAWPFPTTRGSDEQGGFPSG